MKTGTKSILVGAHCFFIHPWFVARAWWILYGFPTDYRLWIAFFLHDLGYWGKAKMDDEEGEKHVEWAAIVMANWFGPEWGNFCLFHSRYYARKLGVPFSRLCVADKLAIALEPWWFYLPRVILSGEVWEYLEYAQGRTDTAHGEDPNSTYARDSQTMRGWHKQMVRYLVRWVARHRHGIADRMTRTTSTTYIAPERPDYEQN